MELVRLTRQSAAFELPLAPSFPLAGMESVGVIELEPPLALSISVVQTEMMEVFESEL